MIINSNQRTTVNRTNSRFRGPTELEKYSNFVLETVHDLKLLGSVMDRNEFIDGHRGHKVIIKDNFESYVGGGVPLEANISTASTICVGKGNVFENIDLLSTDWTTFGGCSKSAGDNGTILSTTGLLDPSGIAAQKYVEEGDIIFIRMGVKLLSGDGNSFSIGSRNINQGSGDVKKFKIPANGSTIYVDKRLHCLHREPITISIDVHNTPEQLVATSVEVFDIEIKYLSENNLTVQPINTIIKSKINNLEDKINNIINTI